MRASRRLAFFFALLATTAFAEQASAAYPGENGKIAFPTAAGISVVNPDGTGATPLGIGGRFPAFSPDGTQIAYNVADSELWVANEDGSDPDMLATDVLGAPSWSPGGDKLAMMESTEPGFITGAIKVIDAGSGAVDTLTPPSGGSYQSPAWHPTDPTLIAISYVTSPPFANNIATITTSGGRAEPPHQRVWILRSGPRLGARRQQARLQPEQHEHPRHLHGPRERWREDAGASRKRLPVRPVLLPRRLEDRVHPDR